MLIGIPRDEYGDAKEYREHILEQYRIYAERIATEQSRAETINGFFLTINTGVITALVITSSDNAPLMGALGAITVAAIATCIAWAMVMLSLGRWQIAQLATIQELETLLPVKPFCAEWRDHLAPKAGYIKIRHIRQLVPWVFLAAHMFIFLTLT